MSPDFVTATRTTDPRYAALEDRILARDQVGASEAYYGLVRAGRPLPEMVARGGAHPRAATPTCPITSASTTASSTSSTTTTAC